MQLFIVANVDGEMEKNAGHGAAAPFAQSSLHGPITQVWCGIMAKLV